MPQSKSPRLPLLGALGTACTCLVLALGASSADAASVVGPSGVISGCYAKKGKAKGTLRVVPAGKRCKKGEQRLAWNAQGQSGQNGATGTGGQTGATGSGGTDTSVLEQRISQLETQVTQLQSILAGVTNTDLLNAIASVAKVNSLCTEVSSVVTEVNAVITALGLPSLTGTLLGLGTLGLSFPSLPSALTPYTCPT